ncbi:MAG: hypothetical protein OHK0023_28370 [Anaerolineae bacterium]
MLVEDSEDDALLTVRALSRSHYPQLIHRRVETESEMREALQEEAWDIVLSDYSMPRFSGTDALRVLLDSGLDIPLIVVSGAIGEERAVEIMKAGASDYIMKDNMARLVPAIERELREVESRRARSQAEDQVSKLSRALEQSSNLIIITDAFGTIEYVNPTFVRVTGYELAEVLEKPYRIINAETTSEALAELMWATVGAGGSWRGELQYRKKDGRLFWGETAFSAIKNQAGVITQYLSVVQDITERKRLELEVQHYTTQLEKMVEERTAELRRAKEQIELILTYTSDALALALPNGDIQTVNPAFINTFGQGASKAIEAMLDVFATEEQISLVSHALMKVILNSETKHVEAQILVDGGQGKDIDLALIPIHLTDDDDRSGVLISARDITRLKDIERFKGRFVADAVHDLATPITGLSTRLYLLQHAPEKAPEHVQALQNQVNHLRNLLEDLRTLSHLDRSRLLLQPELTDLNEIVHRVVDTYAPVAMTKRQLLTFEPDVMLPNISLDVRHFERALVNLVSNAVNYTPNDKAIRVETRVLGSWVELRVADQGIGIAPEELPHIFDRFFRSPQARRTQSAGTGLGLAIVKEIIELHGGRISVESVVGQGSTFIVHMPMRNVNPSTTV